MAILHQATLTPTKPEALAAWVPRQPWAQPSGDVELLGAFRLDDPEGEVGIEVHLVQMGGTLLQVPLTYRGAPLPGAEDHLVTEMAHSALGPRWVYDGLADPVAIPLLAAASLTGCGQALAIVDRDDRRMLVPSAIHLSGGGWTGGPVAVDGLDLLEDGRNGALLRSDRFELRVARRPLAAEPPVLGLTAKIDGLAEPVVLTEVTELSNS